MAELIINVRTCECLTYVTVMKLSIAEFVIQIMSSA